jgi:threonine dehydrogenase-like Zn-dependent dehydrogenase
VAGFYAARGGIIPPLPWTNFAPPLSQESMTQAINCARPGGKIGFVGVPHGVEFNGQDLFFQQKSLLGGPAPVRRFLPYLMELVLNRDINPGKVFDLELPLTDVAEGYHAMDERRAIKTLLRF